MDEPQPALVSRRPAPGIAALLLVSWLVGPPTGLRAAEPAAAAVGKGATLVGTLIIAGGGRLPSAICEHFIELAGGKEARIVVIPTASSRADRPQTLTTYAYFKNKGVNVELLHTRSRQEADTEGFAQRLRNATGVWITGGDQSRLMDAYQGTAVERELHRLLARGKVIGGTSAGAAVMSRVMITGGKTTARLGEGFGFLTGIVVDQHFHNRKRLGRLLTALTQYPRHLGIGIDEETAIIVRGQKLRVLGNASVRVCWPTPTPEEDPGKLLRNGDELDLPDLHQSIFARMASAHDQDRAQDAPTPRQDEQTEAPVAAMR